MSSPVPIMKLFTHFDLDVKLATKVKVKHSFVRYIIDILKYFEVQDGWNFLRLRIK